MDTHTYFGLCADHDWDYYFSLDCERCKNGDRESNILLHHYRKSAKFRDIYDAWYAFKIVNFYAEKPNFKDLINERVENSNRRE